MNHYLLCLISLLTCSQTASIEQQASVFNNSAMILQGRILCHTGYTRIPADSGSFTWYLRHLPLKHSDSLVKYYDGRSKQKRKVYCAVVKMDIGKKDLQQCADAVMRLRAEFLYHHKRYNEITFRFNGDNQLHSYKTYAGNDHSYSKFLKYMEHVFCFANTASLKKQLKLVPFSQMQPGDVLIQSGNPYGHAVIVVDVSKNTKGEKQYLLAQSYMPAQETQILLNPQSGSPWYGRPERSTITTPEWTFDTTDLRRW